MRGRLTVTLVALLAAAAMLGPALADQGRPNVARLIAPGLFVTKVAIESGRLVIDGTAPANALVTLDQRFQRRAGARGTFNFSLIYTTEDCVVMLGTFQGSGNAEVAGCGLKGDTGEAGAPGQPGARGPIGPRGPRGQAGVQGEQGPKGNAGNAGAKGDTGDQGPKGDTGDTGPQGPGVTARGAWESETAYAENDLVLHDGSTWRSLTANTDREPGGENVDWELFAQKGDQGDAGPQGDTGGQGPQGDTGDQGPKGDTGDQGPKGDTGDQGPKGDTGDTGPQGPGVTARGAWESETAYAENDLVLHDGSTWRSLTANTDREPGGENVDWELFAQKGDAGPQGDTGDQGPQGDTGDQGPKGDTGDQGPKGDTGDQGPKGDTGDQGPKGDTGDQGPPGSGAEMFAVIDGGGTWARGYPSGAGYTAGRADSHPAGTYEVIFGTTNITSCAYIITIGSSGYLGTYAPGFATVVGRAGNPAGVFVQTFDTAGTLSDRSFHLMVTCPPSS